MATTSLSSVLADRSPKLELRSSIGLQKSSYLSGPTIFKAPLPQLTPRAAGRRTSGRCYAKKSPLDNVPKQFREENLKDGLAENFKNVPSSLYGLTTSQINMFMTEDNPIQRQAKNVSEEKLSSAWNYLNNGEMYSYSGKDAERGSFSTMGSGVNMLFGGRRRIGRAGRRPRTGPPDLPSVLCDARIVYLGMPIVPAVAQLLLAQFLWMDYDDDTKPIYLYINSTGTRNPQNEIVGSETDAYVIVDAMLLCKADIYTINIGTAYGQAAMLLSLGKKGKRGLQPHSLTKLYKPNAFQTSGAAIDTWIHAKETQALTDTYLRLLSDGIGKPQDEISRDIDTGKFMTAEKAIEYGIADRIMKPTSAEEFDKKPTYKENARARAMRQNYPNASGW